MRLTKRLENQLFPTKDSTIKIFKKMYEKSHFSLRARRAQWWQGLRAREQKYVPRSTGTVIKTGLAICENDIIGSAAIGENPSVAAPSIVAPFVKMTLEAVPPSVKTHQLQTCSAIY